MSLTIVAGFSKNLETLYQLNLSAYVGTEVIAKQDFNETKALLDVLPKIDLIICASEKESGSLIHQLHQYLMEKNKIVPIIAVGDDPDLSNTYQVDPDSDIKPVIKQAAKILGIDAKAMVQQIVPEYFPIEISYFKCVNQSICDIFIREGDEYKAIIEANSTYSLETINELMTQGKTELFVPKDFRLKFVSSVTQGVVSTLSRDDITIGERMKATQATMEVFRDRMGVEVDGMQKETVEMANAAINSLSTVVSDEPNLKSLLANLMNNPGSYLYKHCQLLTFLCWHAIDNMSWGSEEQKEKIAFVSFFHDITLINDEHVKVHSDQDLAKGGFDKKTKDRINNHAVQAAKLVASFPKAPIGVETIIKQHHGSRNGIGFPTHYGDSISPLAIVFIVCETVVDKIFKADSPLDSDFEEIIKGLHYKFTSAKYANVLKALAQLDIS